MLLEELDVDPLDGSLRVSRDPDQRVYECHLDVQAGVCVAFAGDGRVTVADARDRSRLPALGVVSAMLSATHCAVRVGGLLHPSELLVPSRAYFVGADGALVRTVPSSNPGASVYLQEMGRARNAHELVLRPWNFLIRRRA